MTTTKILAMFMFDQRTYITLGIILIICLINVLILRRYAKNNKKGWQKEI